MPGRGPGVRQVQVGEARRGRTTAWTRPRAPSGLAGTGGGGHWPASGHVAGRPRRCSWLRARVQGNVGRAGQGFGQALGRVTPSCPPALSRRRSGPPPRLLAPRVPVRFAGLPFHMAGTRRGLARRAGRRTHPPAQAGEAGDRGTCGEGVTVGQQPRPPGEGAQTEDMVTSGQQSSALPKCRSGSPRLPFLVTFPHERGHPRWLHARVRRGHTPAQPLWLPRTTPRTRTVTGHELTPVCAHPYRSHVSYSDSSLRASWPVRLNIGRMMTEGWRRRQQWRGHPTLPGCWIPSFLPTVVFSMEPFLTLRVGGRGHRGAVFSLPIPGA